MLSHIVPGKPNVNSGKKKVLRNEINLETVSEVR